MKGDLKRFAFLLSLMEAPDWDHDWPQQWKLEFFPYAGYRDEKNRLKRVGKRAAIDHAMLQDSLSKTLNSKNL